LFDFKEFDVIF